MSTRKINRRAFTATASALALTAASAGRVFGANEKVRLGFIGMANRGTQVLDAFLKLDDIQVTAICDVDQTALDRTSEKLKGAAATFGDFRKLIDSKEVDSVIVATPDHWHAIQTITACKA